jgi:hypothetical protein
MGKMAIKVENPDCRLVEIRYLTEASPGKGKPQGKFSHGGLKFKVKNIAPGGSVRMQIISEKNYKKNSEYWKYDETTGYSRMESTVSGNVLSFTLTDGGRGDADLQANGIIDDPGFITEPEETDLQEIDFAGGGCYVSKNASNNTGNGLLLLAPVALLMLLKRLRKV